MGAAAHNPAFAKKMGIPMKVAKEFNAADKGHDLSKLPVHAGHDAPIRFGARPQIIHPPQSHTLPMHKGREGREDIVMKRSD